MSAAPQMFSVRTQLLGYPVDSLDMEDAVSRVDRFVRDGGFQRSQVSAKAGAEASGT